MAVLKLTVEVVSRHATAYAIGVASMLALGTMPVCAQTTVPLAVDPPIVLPALRLLNGRPVVKTGNGTYTPLLSAAGDTMTGPLQILGGSQTSLIDLQTLPPQNGFFAHPTGTFLQMCSQAGCPAGPHMFTQTFGQATTRVDGTAQEIGAFFNFKNMTGYAPNWHTAYNFAAYSNSVPLAAGVIVSSGNILFQARAACTTASSGGGPSTWQTPGYGAPEPTANNVPDGSCTFDYVGPATYQPYTGVGSSQPGNVTAVSNAGNIYTNSVASCTPASSGGGPTGTGANITDGTCNWSFQSAGVNDGKTGFAIASSFEPGGGDGWGFDSTMIIKPGYGSNVWYGFETDFNNLNLDSYAGAPMFALGHFDGGGSAYTYPLYAYYYIGSGAVNSKDNFGNLSRNPYGAHNGFVVSGQGSGSIFGSTNNGSNTVTLASTPLFNLRVGAQWVGPGFPNGTTVTGINGSTITLAASAQGTYPGAAFTYGDYGSVAKDAAFSDQDNASVGFQLLAERQHAAGFEDDSNSTIAVKITGTHGVAGLDLSLGSYGTAIALPSSGFISFSGTSAGALQHFLGFNGITGKLQYGITTSAPQYTWDDSGNFSMSGNLSLTGAAGAINFPASAGAAGTTNKLNFFNNGYGLGVSIGSLDLVSAGQVAVYSGPTVLATFSTVGLNIASGGLTAPNLPTAGGAVKGSACVDTTGKFYVKTTTGSCL